MVQATVTPTEGMRNSAFGALAAAILGLALLETGWMLLQVPAIVHMLSLLVGGPLVAVMSRRFVHYWPNDRQASANVSHGRQLLKPRVLSVVACALISAAGYFGADALANGLVSPFIFFALAVTFLPWTKIARTRAHCLAYGEVAVLAISAALLLGYARLNPVLLIAVTWVLWMATIAGWVRIVTQEKRQQRKAAVAPLAQAHPAKGDRDGRLGAGAAADALSDAHPRNRSN